SRRCINKVWIPVLIQSEPVRPQNDVVNSVSHCGDASTSTASILLSVPETIATPITMNAAPSRPLPSFPADIRLERTRIKVARDTSPSRISGNAAPTPNTAIVSVTRGRSCPCEARSDAAPKVGPTQGDQTAPSKRPIANCPPSPDDE